MGGIIIPSETDLDPEGVFFGQIVIPKKDHITNWGIGKVIGISKPELASGFVLDLVDIVTGCRYQEMLVYVDFLVSIKISSDIKMLRVHQLVTPRFCDGKSLDWLVGYICSPMDGVDGAFKNYIVTDVQDNNKSYKISIDEIELLMRIESSFLSEI